MANNSLSRTDKRIRADEPLCLRIVIPALEVVQLRLGVVNVAPVAEDIQVCNVRGRRDRVAARVSDLKEPAPAVINVFCRKRVAFRPQLKYITFDVFNEIIFRCRRSVEIAQSIRTSGSIIEIFDVLAAPFVAEKERSVIGVIVDRSADGLGSLRFFFS